ncbi:MAG: hypothetical protein COA83_09610 [Methylophaga sp.]|nr:MAG: hypothetical protein COA83_09610 [Methylophaga sp.]
MNISERKLELEKRILDLVVSEAQKFNEETGVFITSVSIDSSVRVNTSDQKVQQVVFTRVASETDL